MVLTPEQAERAERHKQAALLKRQERSKWTPAQRERMERNKRQALEKRQKKNTPAVLPQTTLNFVSLAFTTPTKRPLQSSPPEERKAKKAESSPPESIVVNRSPVMTMWAAAVARRALKVSWREGLSLGAAAAAICARRKGQSLDLYKDTPEKSTEKQVQLLGFDVGVRGGDDDDDDSIRGVDSQGHVKDPAAVERSLRSKFGDHYDFFKTEFNDLADTYDLDDLNSNLAYDLYETFRPNVPPGRAGWGKPGRLTVSTIRACRKKQNIKVTPNDSL